MRDVITKHSHKESARVLTRTANKITKTNWKPGGKKQKDMIRIVLQSKKQQASWKVEETHQTRLPKMLTY